MTFDPSVYGELTPENQKHIEESASFFWVIHGENAPDPELTKREDIAWGPFYSPDPVEVVSLEVEEINDATKSYKHIWKLKVKKPDEYGDPNAGRTHVERFYCNPPLGGSLDQMSTISFGNLNQLLVAVGTEPIRNAVGGIDYYNTITQRCIGQRFTAVMKHQNAPDKHGIMRHNQDISRFEPLQ